MWLFGSKNKVKGSMLDYLFHVENQLFMQVCNMKWAAQDVQDGCKTDVQCVTAVGY